MNLLKIKWVLFIFVFVSIATSAPLLHSEDPNVLQGLYIIVLKDGLSIATRDNHIQALKYTISATNVDASVGEPFNINSMHGFSARLTEDLLKAELAHPDVKYIEADRAVTLDYQQSQEYTPSLAVVTQAGATWGLVRISQRVANYSAPYVYNANAGEGIDIYCIDTGIFTQHVDFGGRAIIGYNAFSSEQPGDLNGHGTHIAGTIAGNLYGVAKRARLISVKVICTTGETQPTCSTPLSTVINGVNYVTNNVTSARRAIACVSVGVRGSTAFDEAVSKSIAAGISYVTAAGNENANACEFSPARVSGVFVAGAVTNTTTRSSFSNIGPCVDLFAPGQLITSDWIGSITATNTISGSSTAAAHAAGALAAQLSIDPSRSASFLVAQATPNVVINPGNGSPNLLLFSPAQ